jgi:hypothetical protein
MYMHNEPIETITAPAHFEQGRFVEHQTLKIYIDPEPLNPRTESDNMGHMVCFHKRYDLGDEVQGISYTRIQNEFDSWDEVEDYLIKEMEAVVILPLYLYDHSGITMRTHSFNDRWDSGQVGYIYATRKDILDNWGGKKLTKELRQKAHDLLVAEVQDYDDYLTGNVYGYVLEDEAGDEIDSCWGYAGNNAPARIKGEVYIHIIRPQLMGIVKSEA